MTFFINIKLITKSIDISFQVRLTACIFVLESKELDVLMSTSMFWITSKPIQTARIDSNRASHLISDKFLSFSEISTSFDAPSNVSALKGNRGFKTLHNPAQNSFPGDFIHLHLICYFPSGFVSSACC